MSNHPLLILVFLFLLHSLVVFCKLFSITQSQQQQICSTNVRPPLCFQITCGWKTPKLYANSTACRTCSREDIGSRWTECNPVDNMKSIVYFWKPPATCIVEPDQILKNPYAVLPKPVTEIPCSTQCEPLEFLNTTTKSCERCELGSVTKNGRFVVDFWEEELPIQMYSQCDSIDGTCEKWTSRGDFIDSGDNDYKILTNSTLEFNIELIYAGSISFEYQFISDSPNQALYFYINNRQHDSYSNSLPVDEWKTVTYNLAPGYYSFQWRIRRGVEYYKTNLAKIRKIDLSGLSNAETYCTKCTPGKYNDGTSFTCKACPVNTYNNVAGSVNCTPCANYYSSKAGSTECVPDPLVVCTEKDYFYKYSVCAQGFQLEMTEWIQPMRCDPNHPQSITLPTQTIKNCNTPQCRAGQILSNGICDYCPKGYFATDGKCNLCPLGSGTHNIYYIDNFIHSQNDRIIETKCVGDCGYQGWRFAGNHLETGFGNGDSESTAFIEISPIQNPSVVVSYSVNCVKDGSYLLFVANNKELKRVDCSKMSCTAVASNVIQDVFDLSNIEVDLAKKIIFSIIFVKSRPNADVDKYNDNCSTVKIYNMAIKGSTLGGSASCEVCPAGTFSDALTNCDLCAAGTFSKAGSSNCTECVVNYFSKTGSSDCLFCGKGLQSAKRSEFCYYSLGLPAVEGAVGTISRRFEFKNTALHFKSIAIVDSIDANKQFFLNLLLEKDHPVCGSSLVCLKNGQNQVISIGDNADMTPFISKDYIGVKIMSQSVKPTCSATKTQSSTTINLLCPVSKDPETGLEKQQQQPSFSVTVATVDTCAYQIDIYTQDACPLCKNEDYFLYKGDCINGKQETKWLKRLEAIHTCYDGVTKSSNVTLVSCVPSFSLDAPYWLVVMLIVTAVIVVLALVGITLFAVILYIRNRTLYSQFAEMADEKADANNANHESSDEEGDEEEEEEEEETNARKNSQSTVQIVSVPKQNSTMTPVAK